MAIYISNEKHNALNIISSEIIKIVYIFTIVYKSLSGRLGFDTDQNAEKFISLVAKNSWIWDSERSNIEVVNNNDRLIAAIRKNLSISIHNPSILLINEFNNIEGFKKVQKINRMRQKYGKEPSQISEPIIYKILSNEFIDNEENLDLILDNSDFFLKWKFNEYGLHFQAFTKKKTHFLDLIENCSKLVGIKKINVDSDKDLPIW